ncbi:DUF962 domain-containing protein [Pararobbsia silviterrae]|uniref:DUF962 domain-containing protein n=1 Tax=Pararobbsia silviterrae TaxID=1792498 RepID=A0A494XKQ8_9BURK|nr:Mpo1-like protein [Pararobbsia silviterrae]RKP48654.1 DUF962 domain-containing protein [Pararobbsia silviterrae]
MKSLAEQMSIYQRYHRNPKNKATHFVGVPAIVLAVMLALSWVPIGHSGITLADVLVVPLLVYYFRLDGPLALASTIVLGALLALAHGLDANLSQTGAWIAFGVLFVGGWIVQLVGHAFEGRKPALADNLFQVFIAPIFLVAEVFFACGYKPGLREAVEAGHPRHA